MRRRLLRFCVFFLPVVGGLCATAIGLARVNWPSAGYWNPTVIVWCIVVAGAIPAVQTTISELGEKRRSRALELEDNVRAPLAASLVVIARECKAPWAEIGIQAFVVSGLWWRKRQVRVAKIRLSSIASSGVAWTKGKGVIGWCWETRRSQWAQLDESPFSDLAKLPAYRWPVQDRAVTYGLSFDDYQALGSKYGTVAAVPMMSGDDYIGCITLDTPAGVRLEQSDVALQSLAATADVVRRLLGK